MGSFDKFPHPGAGQQDSSLPQPLQKHSSNEKKKTFKEKYKITMRTYHNPIQRNNIKALLHAMALAEQC